MERFMTARLAAALTFALTLALAPGAAGAQSMEEVDTLIRDGYMQEAREALLRWEANNPRPGREDAQRLLWFRAVLTLDPAQAESTLRRLVLEYPGGTFTPQALQRLGQGAALRGDVETARRHYSVLIRDYPSSPGRVEAQNWMIRNREALAALDAGAPEGGAAPRTEQAPAAVPPRSDTDPAPPVIPPAAAGRGADSTEAGAGDGAPVDPGATGVPADEPGGEYSAQLGAFGALEGARRLAAQVRARGFDPRIVQLPGSAFYRVRVGRYGTAETARSVIETLRAAGFDAGLGTRGGEETAVPG